MRVTVFAITTILQLAAAAEEEVEWGRRVGQEQEDEQAAPVLRKREQSQHKSFQQQRQHQQHRQHRQTGEELYDAYLGLIDDEGIDGGHEQRRQLQSMSTMMSMSMPMPAAMCSFCADGVTNPDLELTDPDTGTKVTCAVTQAGLSRIPATDPVCADASLAELLCCPPLVEGGLGPAVMPEVCSFCPAGLVDPDLVLPTDEKATCSQAAGFAAGLAPEDDACTTVQLAQGLCCPPGNGVPPTDPTEPAPVPLPELENGQCSCSPTVYDFKLDLGQDCATDDLEGKPGIGLTFCFLGVSSAGGLRRLRSDASASSGGGIGGPRLLKKDDAEIEKVSKINLEDPLGEAVPEKLARQIADGSLEVISVQFLEFDTSGALVVLNQDDTYSNVSLANGDVFTFKSISSDLDPGVPIEDQLDLLPGGVQVTLRGRVFDEESQENKIVSNRITWSYDNACDVVPITGGESIGWTTIEDVSPASDVFCPALRTPSTTAATTTVAATTAAETTEAPPPDTTGAPPATTAATEGPPPATTAATEGPPPATTDRPPLLGKSGKSGSKSDKSGKSGSKSAKALKKSSVSPKTNKTPKNPMAKVHKASSTDDGQHGGASSADAKSGKAKVDKDAKAEKEAMGKAGKDAKSGKSSKSLGKSGKSGEGKSGKSGDKESKATKLFKTPVHAESMASDGMSL